MTRSIDVLWVREDVLGGRLVRLREEEEEGEEDHHRRGEEAAAAEEAAPAL